MSISHNMQSRSLQLSTAILKSNLNLYTSNIHKNYFVKPASKVVSVWKTDEILCFFSTGHDKCQLISKCRFGVFNFFQKMNKNKSTWGIIVVKLNSFVQFLEESLAWKNHFNFVWHLEIFKSQPLYSSMQLK